MTPSKLNSAARRPNRWVFITALTALIAGCSLELTNPNQPTEEAVVGDLNGVLAVAVGMQQQYAQAIEDYLVTNSLVTDEWGTRTASLIAYQSLLTGVNFDDSYLRSEERRVGDGCRE